MPETFLIKYYNDLYLFQNEVLGLIDRLDFNFYLGGGTALIRFYLDHRYSDDVDLFSPDDQNFETHIQQISEILMAHEFKVETFGMSHQFARFHIMHGQKHPDVVLKADFINGKKIPHFGDFKSTDIFSKIDNMRNILSDKLTFIYKKSPKDVADIWFICKNLWFQWEDVMQEASKKRAIEPLFVVDSLRNFSPAELNKINWARPVDIETFEHDRAIMIKNIIAKYENQLFNG